MSRIGEGTTHGRLRLRLGAALLFVGVAGLVNASAATLAVDHDQLGAEVSLVATCDTSVTATLTTAYQVAVPGYYRVTHVVVSGIAGACTGQSLSVTTTGAGGASLGSGTTTVTGATTSVPVTPTSPNPTIDSRAVTGVAVAITGL